MSLTSVEEIQRKKTELQNRLHSMEEHRKSIGEQIKLLIEKLELQELEERVNAKHHFVERLESLQKDLEKRSDTPAKVEPQRKQHIEVRESPPVTPKPKPVAIHASSEPRREVEKEKKQKKRFF